MNSKLLYITTIILTLVGCASEDYVGNHELHEANENGRPVSFGLSSAPQTRSDRYGADAASDLNNNFVVWGDKTITEGGSTTTQTVFNNYQVNYVTNSAYTTTSNSAGWEYVGYKNLPNGVTTNVGVTAFSALTGSGQANADAVDQTIKYWDFGATNYHFFAYSLGKGDKPGDPNTKYATASKLYDETDGHKYTLTGTTDQLAACYITDKVTKTDMSATKTQVSLKFRRLGAKINIGLYENIPGYSVKDVKFYQGNALTPAVNFTQAEIDAAQPGDPAYEKTTSNVKIPAGQTACLYAADGTTKFNRNDGTFTITFAGDGSPLFGWPTDHAADLNYISFGNSAEWTTWRAKEYEEVGTDNVFVGRSSTLATGPSDFKTILPYTAGTNLALKVDFTLLSRDQSGETIEVKGATAIVPAQFAAWKPNCSYTYLFKISDNTDGHIGAVQGLYPITLDAVVNVSADGTQETITTVTEPSITTYQKGSDYLTNDVYNEGDIYVVVYSSTYNETGGVVPLTAEADNAKLYEAVVTSVADPVNKPANITEATAENAIANPSADNKDANDNPMTVTEINPSILAFVSSIPGEATPDGNPINVNGAKFTAVAGKTYVFQFLKEPAVNYTPEEAAAYNATLTGALNSTDPLTADQASSYNARMSGSKSEGDTLSAAEANAYNATLTGHKTSDDVMTSAKYQYKVIKVASGS